MKKQDCILLFERYICNQATDEEIKRLSDWITNNPAISSWLEQQILSSSSVVDIDVQMKMLNNIRQHIFNVKEKSITAQENTQKRFRINEWIKVAAMLILPLFTAVGMYMYMSNMTTKSSPLIITAGLGQKVDIILPDGSRVWLNSQSKLSYQPDYNQKKRILQLDGEAYFEVVKIKNKAFIVKTNEYVEVEALGTKFGVKAYKDDNFISSILTKGTIKVTTSNGSSILKPNERLIYNKLTKKVVKKEVTNAVDYTSWIDGGLRFEDESLAEITKAIQRIYDVEFTFASEKLKNMRYTGTVKNTNLESMLNVITLTSPISFLINENHIVFYEDKERMKHYNP